MALSRVGGRQIDDVDRRVVTGTDGDDVLNESNQVDAVDINGLAGDDIITGTSVAGVSDVLRGGAGNDTFFGLAGDDFIIPGAGDDLRVVGGAGSDTFFPETNGGDDIFPEFSLQDRLDGTLLDGIEAIEVSRLGNGRTLVEFVGANTTTQISGGVSPEGFVAAANDILVNFPPGTEVRVQGSDIVNVIDDAGAVEEVIVEEEIIEEVIEEEVVEEVGNNNNGGGVVGDATAAFGGGQGTPGAVQSTVANNQGGLDVTGTDGRDPIAFGNTGDDNIRGFGGNDAIVGFNGNDFLDGGDGDDFVFGSQDDDIVLGGAGNDVVRGDNEAAGNGADIIVGGPGDDLLKGDGNNLVGADRFVFSAGDGNDIIQDFQVDVDTLDFTSFGNEEIDISQQGSDTLVSVGDVNVTLQGVDADDLDAGDFDGGLFGGNQAVVEEEIIEEVIEEEVIEEEVVEEVGNNNNGGGVVGDATAAFGGGQGTPGAVQSTVANNQGGLDVTGTDGRDPIAFGNTGDDNIRGFGGNDAIVGFNGNDFLDGGDGDDFVFGSQDDDIVLGGAGNDVVRGDNEAAGNGADIIVGGPGDDLLKGDGNNLVGADRFVFSAGDGNDIIQDFQVDVDTLDFTSFGNEEIDISQQGSDTLVSVGDVNVTLQGVDADDLSEDDFDGGSLGVA